MTKEKLASVLELNSNKAHLACRERKVVEVTDETEAKRMALMREINANPQTREALSHTFGQVWDTQQLQAEFEVQAFLAPFVVVKRKADGVRGTLMFQHSPRLYFSFASADEVN